MSRYHITTLGCRANAADSTQLGARLRGDGHHSVSSPAEADLIIINSCSVTANADADARRLARRFRRLSPDAEIVVTGCVAERDPELVASWPAVDRVVGNRLKLRLPEILAGSLDGSNQTGVWEAPSAYPLFGEGGYTRAFVKIQDGCDARCSFCIIPKTRGGGRSVAPSAVLDEVRHLGGQGVREVVLSGIHLGRYGRDLQPAVELADLLAQLTSLAAPERIRVTSIEPRELTDGLVDALAHERVARHVHVPLQSGSDRVLRRMRRPYDARFYAAQIDKLARRLGAVSIGADVMVGFPGETDEDFEATRQLLADSPVSYLHVFRYSPRPGTPAESYTGQVPSQVAKARSAALRAFSRRRSLEWRQSLRGRTELALTLTETAEATNGLTGNYVRVSLPPGLGLNRLFEVELGEAGPAESQARPLASHRPVQLAEVSA